MILLDSDILIDLLRSKKETTDWFEKKWPQWNGVGISIITKWELLNGSRNKKERETLNDWLLSYQIIHLSEAMSIKADEVFKKYNPKQGLGILDALIAATAICQNLPFYSKNQKHFKGIADLMIKEPLN